MSDHNDTTSKFDKAVKIYEQHKDDPDFQDTVIAGMIEMQKHETFEVVNKEDGLLVRYNFGQNVGVKSFNGRGLDEFLAKNTPDGHGRTPRVGIIEDAISALKAAKVAVANGDMQLSDFPRFKDPFTPGVRPDRAVLSVVHGSAPRTDLS